MILLPRSVHHVEPFRCARVAIVVLVEFHAVLFRFLGPPGRNHIQRNAAVRDVVNIRGLLGEQRGQMKRGPHRDHQLERFGDGGERGGGGPGVERRRVDALDVVQIQLGDEREVEADFFAAAREARNVAPSSFPFARRPRCAASRRKPASSIRSASARLLRLSVFRQREALRLDETCTIGHGMPCPCGGGGKAVRDCISAPPDQIIYQRSKGLKPTMRGPSETKLESALMS